MLWISYQQSNRFATFMESAFGKYVFGNLEFQVQLETLSVQLIGIDTTFEKTFQNNDLTWR